MDWLVKLDPAVRAADGKGDPRPLFAVKRPLEGIEHACASTMAVSLEGLTDLLVLAVSFWSVRHRLVSKTSTDIAILEQR